LDDSDVPSLLFVRALSAPRQDPALGSEARAEVQEGRSPPWALFAEREDILRSNDLTWK
jgi:hypothetical protein